MTVRDEELVQRLKKDAIICKKELRQKRLNYKKQQLHADEDQELNIIMTYNSASVK